MQNTSNYNLKKPERLIDFFTVENENDNMDIIDAALVDLSKVFVAGGTSTAITIEVHSLSAYYDGLKLTVVASANNAGAATTIKANALSAVPLYKPGTTTAPALKAGKAYDVWYDVTGNCFFLKASAEGTAQANHVLAPYTISNDDDIGIAGTITSKGAQTYVPTTTDQTIAASQYLSGVQTIAGDADLIADNIVDTANIFNVQGTAQKLVANKAKYTQYHMYRRKKDGFSYKVVDLGAGNANINKYDSSGTLISSIPISGNDVVGHHEIFLEDTICLPNYSARTKARVYDYSGNLLQETGQIYSNSAWVGGYHYLLGVAYSTYYSDHRLSFKDSAGTLFQTYTDANTLSGSIYASEMLENTIAIIRGSVQYLFRKSGSSMATLYRSPTTITDVNFSMFMRFLIGGHSIGGEINN